MEKCLKKLLREIILIAIFMCGVSLAVFTYTVWNNSGDALERGLWLQSTEQQLKEQNDEYYNELYNRYSKIQRDMIDYQKSTNNRMDILEKRIESLEKRLLQGSSMNTTYINNNQVHR